MGLDCTAYRQLKKIGPIADGEDADIHFYRHMDKEFPGRADDIEQGVAYEAADSFGWRAGSYSGYSRWRAQLGDIFGYNARWCEPATVHGQGTWDVPDDGPFTELCNFSDCEGTLGTATCAKLAQDFAAFQNVADAHRDDWFRAKYADWRKACEMAADGGAIAFH